MAGFFMLHCAKDQQATARMGLDAINRLVTAETLQYTDYKDLSEVAKSRLGDPMKVYTLGLDDIDKYADGKTAAQLFREDDSFVYPVYVGDEIRSSVAIQKVGGKWEIMELGGRIAFSAEPGKKRMLEVQKDFKGPYFVVYVPAMYLIMLGYENDGKLYLAPTHDHPDLKIKPLEAVVADVALRDLKANTRKYRNALVPGNRDEIK